MSKTSVVIPNWNGADRLRGCLSALVAQSEPHQTVVVDNGSTDDSVRLIEKTYSSVHLIKHRRNRGFAGGVNSGIKYAMEQGADYVALLNNDALAEKKWLENLVRFLDKTPEAGIATAKILDDQKKRLDSTGDLYTVWGLPYPRGRDETDTGQYDKDTWVFGASGGASLYRVRMLEQIGLFDEDFFAYYEDVDISFRAQLAGWKIGYVPEAAVYHQIGATSGTIKGFTTYQTLKNLPLLLWKNVPWALLPKVWPRLALAYWGFIFRAVRRGQFVPLFKGWAMSVILVVKKTPQRRKIQSSRRVPVSYINSIITHDLPPNARRLRNLRTMWHKLRGRT